MRVTCTSSRWDLERAAAALLSCVEALLTVLWSFHCTRTMPPESANTVACELARLRWMCHTQGDKYGSRPISELDVTAWEVCRQPATPQLQLRCPRPCSGSSLPLCKDTQARL